MIRRFAPLRYGKTDLNRPNSLEQWKIMLIMLIEYMIIVTITHYSHWIFFKCLFALWQLFESALIIQIIYIILIMPFLGSYGSWNCRSRVEGKTRRDRPNGWGRAVSSSYERWLAEISTSRGFQTAHAVRPASAASSTGQGTLVVGEHEWWWAASFPAVVLICAINIDTYSIF